MTLAAMSTAEVKERLAVGETCFVDVRSPDAFNGWRLADEARGGHIPGARNLPARWTAYLDWPEIVVSKGLSPSDPLVIYGHDPEEMEAVGCILDQMGFADIHAYPGFLAEWTTDPNLPLDRLARYQHLVPPEWLRDQTNVVMCHCHYRNEADYHAGHIPGAIPLNTLALESPETWNRRTPDELDSALAAHGIRRDTVVVLYGRDSTPDPDDPFPGSSAGQLAAMRCAFLLLYAGVKDVRVLNGGLRSWQDAGLPITTKASSPKPVDGFGARVPAYPEIAFDKLDVKRLLGTGSGKLVSMRSRAEVEGRVSGYDYMEARGRIPGEVFGDNGSDAYHMENYRNPDQTTLEYPMVEASLKAAGVTREHHVAFFCGTGWRASEAFWNTWMMGWPRVAVYDGGWFEWSNDPENAIETGPLADEPWQDQPQSPLQGLAAR